ncbi:glycosyltransferase family 2 protein [Janibacter sp. DB-40]|uniref:glycosyltransferase family 2 protein n=1 Tax=Janibacter sp. DB-40 TaxID=3028808 RepID=UPI002405C8B3|nr:glycosyltransferase family 2 protein [Janibacter sp. DB-40]
MSEVSVVIPVRDDAELLRECLRALGRQSEPPLEIIVVDNASSDHSAAVALSHGARVVREPNVGIAYATATGYDAARGAIIARLDADTRPPTDWLERIGTVMAGHPGHEAVTGIGVFHDAPRGLRRLLSVIYLGSYYLLGAAAAGHHVLWGSSMAVRRTAWQRVTHLVHRDLEVHDDFDLALVLGPGAAIVLDPSLVVGVSARSVRGGRQWRRRLGRAFHTLRLNWRDAPPWERWAVTLHLQDTDETRGSHR